ncbi:MAG: CRISPR-associated endoribonuclease Cas6 [Ignavibacteriaceae bacterium]|nr:CRISPR-associated endoribonuclease Cas6 [Ignavibacteriaceae bacterium]
MRLHFLLSPNSEIVPFNYQHYLIGVFHKWMGLNEIHDEVSLYSLSWLRGSRQIKGGLDYTNGAKWFISFWDEEIGRKLINNAMNYPDVFCGMVIKEIIIQETPKFSSKETFSVSSPVFIRKYDSDKRAIHLTYKDKEADHYLTETLKRKMKGANIDYKVDVKFDRNYSAPKTKLVEINNIKSRASFCPVILEGDPKGIQFAWNVGIGHSSGCGFGAIY